MQLKSNNTSSNNTFGDEIEDFEDLHNKKLQEAKVIEFTSKPCIKINKEEYKKQAAKISIPLNQKEPKSKKVKFSSLARYIITELALFDEEWENIEYEIAFEESKADDFEESKEDAFDDTIIEQLEFRQSEILGSVNALFLLGRNFGVSKSDMIKYIPNINAYEHSKVETELDNVKALG